MLVKTVFAKTQLFTEICDYKEVSDNVNGFARNVVLSHYPILIWNNQHKGWLHLYGHLHNSMEWSIYKESLKLLNEYFAYQTMYGRTDCPQVYAYNISCIIFIFFFKY